MPAAAVTYVGKVKLPATLTVATYNVNYGLRDADFDPKNPEYRF